MAGGGGGGGGGKCILLVSVDKYPSEKVIVSSGLSASMSQQKNELKENNNGFGYLFHVIISWIFFKT